LHDFIELQQGNDTAGYQAKTCKTGGWNRLAGLPLVCIILLKKTIKNAYIINKVCFYSSILILKPI
jgi:uncharacterized protein (DUF2235 family)